MKLDILLYYLHHIWPLYQNSDQDKQQTMDVGMTLLFWFCDKLVCEVGFLCVAYRICQNKYSSINVLMK